VGIADYWFAAAQSERAELCMSDNQQTRVAAASLVSGAVSGMLGVATGFPLETLRVRVQTQVAHSEYRGPWDCLFKTVRGEGFRGLYKVEKAKRKAQRFVLTLQVRA